MENKILFERICKMIAITFALPENEVQSVYDQTNSIDVVIEVVKNSILNHTSLQQEVFERKKNV